MGNWHSPISADRVAAGSVSVSETRLYDGALYWLERRPQDKGRTTIVCYQSGQITDCLPDEYNCRSRVHEYGGGAYTVSASGIFFVNDEDQQIYHLHHGNFSVTAITRKPGCRYADIQVDEHKQRLIAVEEDHTGEQSEPDNTLVTIDLKDGDVRCLCRQHDFYASPRIDTSSRQLCWLSWNHPNMPWDGCQLYAADYTDDHTLSPPQLIAGDDATSIFQPQWHHGTLYYVSDTSGWWNLYRYSDGSSINLCPQSAEFGLPQWVFAQSTYCFCNNRLIACRNHAGSQTLVEIDLATHAVKQIPSPYTQFDYLTSDDNDVAFIAASASQPAAVTTWTDDAFHTVTPDPDDKLDSRYCSSPVAYQLTSRHGDNIHASYYPPANPHHDTDTCTPPLIVIGHGGPTGQSSNSFDLKKLYWTSRGFAILDVDYSGSTGYGRDYKNRLAGQWGQRDVSDMCDAALAMVERGLAAADKLIIKGSSAGGYTVLAALTFEDVFHAGASYYGISDLETLTTDTHKFESHYLDSLIGAYPQMKLTYQQRSPIHFTDRLNCPVIFFQGEEDKVVPKEQAETMVKALDAQGIPVAYLLFAGEQHGFRQAQTIIDALEAELCFYRRIFEPGETDCELEISNLG